MVWREEEDGGVKEERERGGKNTLHLKRKKKNGSPEIETRGEENEMAKEGIKCERKGAQRMCKFADGMKSGGPMRSRRTTG